MSLELDDPQVQSLQQRISDWGRPRPNTATAVARWRWELAEFYAAQNAKAAASSRAQPTVAMVSYAGPSPNGPAETSDRDAATPDPSGREKTMLAENKAVSVASGTKGVTGESAGADWSRWATQAEQTFRQLERRRAEWHQRAAASCPIKLGPVIQPGLPRHAFLTAGTVALAVFALAWYWGIRAAPIQLASTNSLVSSELTHAGEQDAAAGPAEILELTLPRHWVQVNQPLGVQLRRVCFALVVVAAIVTLFLADPFQLPIQS